MFRAKKIDAHFICIYLLEIIDGLSKYGLVLITRNSGDLHYDISVLLKSL